MRFLFFFLSIALVFGVSVEFSLTQPTGAVIPDYIDISELEDLSLYLKAMSSDTCELSYDNNAVMGSYTELSVGDGEALRFLPEHPCSIYKIAFYLRGGAGSIEALVWGNFSHIPDLDNELLPPYNLEASAAAGWYIYDLLDVYGHGLYVPALEYFHVGRRVTATGPPYMTVATNTTDPISYIYVQDEGNWFGVSDGENYIPYKIRCFGRYFDIDTVKTFRNIATEAGLTEGGRTVAFADINNNGFDDVICSGRLYMNNTDGTFTYSGFSFGGRTSFGDFTGDGWLDAVTASTPIKLWRNNRDGTFTDVTADWGFAEFPGRRNCGAFGDLTGNGWLDLYISYGEDWNDGDPIYYSDRVYRNVEGLYFEEITAILPRAVRNEQYSRGVHIADYTGNGYMDVYVSRYRLQRNILLRNNGDGTFEEVGMTANVAGHNHGGAFGHTIGSVWADINNNGHFDLICANLAHPRFYDFSDKTYIFINNGDGTFTDVFAESGISYFETHSNPAVADFDNDGNLDIFFANVYDGYRNHIYRGHGDGTFSPADYETGIWGDNGWGAAWSDIDNNFKLDLVTSVRGGLQLWKNNTPTDGNNAIKIDAWCDITTNNRFAYGTQARLYLPDGRIISRLIQGNTGTEGGMDSRTMHFGVGRNDFADSLVVNFPRGIRHVFYEIDCRFVQYDVFESGIMDGYGIEEPKQIMPNLLSIQSSPNPFNSSLNIEIEVKTRGDFRLQVYDMNGNLVNNIAKGQIIPGRRQFNWNGKNQLGRDMPSGIYLIGLSTNKSYITQRVVLVR